MSRSRRIVLAFVLCVFVTGIIRGGPLEFSVAGERIAITLVWVLGVAWMIWMTAKNSN